MFIFYRTKLVQYNSTTNALQIQMNSYPIQPLFVSFTNVVFILGCCFGWHCTSVSVHLVCYCSVTSFYKNLNDHQDTKMKPSFIAMNSCLCHKQVLSTVSSFALSLKSKICFFFFLKRICSSQCYLTVFAGWGLVRLHLHEGPAQGHVGRSVVFLFSLRYLTTSWKCLCVFIWGRLH